MRLIHSESHLNVTDYRCEARPRDAPFEEVHRSYCVAFVRKGSFSCRARNHDFDLVPGSFFIGSPGETFVCSHAHHAGRDECLSFDFDQQAIEELGGSRRFWRQIAIPPLTASAPLGALAQATLDGRCLLSPFEAGLFLTSRLIDLWRGRQRGQPTPSDRDRRRCIDTALWLEANSSSMVSLAKVSMIAGLSAFHFLRVFKAVIGASPHQYLIGCRLRRAVQTLSETDMSITAVAQEVGFQDLSNFVRTFGRQMGMSPGRFRRDCRRDRNILQERLRSRLLK